MGLSGGFQSIDHFLTVRSRGDGQGNDNQPLSPREGPICYRIGYEFGVRQNDFRAISCANYAGADADLLDDSFCGVDLDDVANFDRTFKKQNLASNEVIDDVLQTETEADTEGASED